MLGYYSVHGTNHDFKRNNILAPVEQIMTSRGTKNLASMEQIRLQGEQIISACGTNATTRETKHLVSMEQITISRGTISACGINATTRGTNN
jgi:hypothetical protein